MQTTKNETTTQWRRKSSSSSVEGFSTNPSYDNIITDRPVPRTVSILPTLYDGDVGDVGDDKAIEPPPSDAAIEGFSNKDTDEIKKKVKQLVFLPVTMARSFKPSKLVENERTNRGLIYLAAVSLPNMFLGGSGKKKSKKADQKKNDESLLDKMDSFLETTSDLASTMDPDALEKQIEEQKQLAEEKGLATGGAIFDAAGNEIKSTTDAATADAATAATAAEEKCPDEGNPNADFLSDAALIKLYAFRTIVLLLSYWSVLNVSFFYFMETEPRKPEVFGEITCETINKWFPNTDWAANLMQVPFIGPVLHYLATTAYATIREWNPFMFSQLFFERFFRYHQYVAYSLLNMFDFKIWGLIFLGVLFYGNMRVLETYETTMNTIRSGKTDFITSMLYLAFVWYWLESFVTRLFLTIQDIFIMMTTIIGLIFIIIFNLYLFIIMNFNCYVVYLLLVLWYFYITVFIVFFGGGKTTGGFFDRLRKLDEKIEASAAAALDGDAPQSWKQFGRSVLHYMYNNKFFLGILFWLLHVFRIFYKNLRVQNLRQNMFLFIGMAALVIILWKLGWDTFGKDSGAPPPQTNNM